MMKNLDAPDLHRPVAEIVSLAEVRDQRTAEAWRRFVAAQERSKQTLRLEDGIAAGRAYAEFLRTFAGGRG